MIVFQGDHYPNHPLTVVYCTYNHDWRSAVYEGGVGGLHRCPECGGSTSFVHFNPAEFEDAERLTGAPLAFDGNVSAGLRKAVSAVKGQK